MTFRVNRLLLGCMLGLDSFGPLGLDLLWTFGPITLLGFQLGILAQWAVGLRLNGPLILYWAADGGPTQAVRLDFVGPSNFRFSQQTVGDFPGGPPEVPEQQLKLFYKNKLMIIKYNYILLRRGQVITISDLTYYRSEIGLTLGIFSPYPYSFYSCIIVSLQPPFSLLLYKRGEKHDHYLSKSWLDFYET